MHILLVEDEAKVARFIKEGLTAEGYDVEIAADGKAGEKKALTGEFDLVLLDVLLPKKNGFEVLRTLRNEGMRTPVLMLTARSTTEDIVQGLDHGADDYLTKPFAFNELLARIRSLLRRQRNSHTTFRLADLQLDTLTRKATRSGTTIELTAREYSLLEYFMRNPGRILTRTMISEHVWSIKFDTFTNVIDVYINYLRNKIDKDYPKKLLQTVRGVGYMLKD